MAEKEIRLEQAIDILEGHESIRSKEYMSLLSVSSATATRDLKELVKMGILMPEGKGRGRIYKKTIK